MHGITKKLVLVKQVLMQTITVKTFVQKILSEEINRPRLSNMEIKLLYIQLHFRALGKTHGKSFSARTIY